MHPTKKNNYLFLFLTISFLGELFHCDSGFQTKKICVLLGTLKLKFERNGKEYQKTLRVNLSYIIQMQMPPYAGEIHLPLMNGPLII